VRAADDSLINIENSQKTNITLHLLGPHPCRCHLPLPALPLRGRAHQMRRCADMRTNKKCCFGQTYWIFDGRAWVRPSSDSEVVMVHPEYSERQLVILSGPYIKWELRRDPIVSYHRGNYASGVSEHHLSSCTTPTAP